MHLSIFANDLLQQSLALLVTVELLLLYVSGKIYIYIQKPASSPPYMEVLKHADWVCNNLFENFRSRRQYYTTETISHLKVMYAFTCQAFNWNHTVIEGFRQEGPPGGLLATPTANFKAISGCLGPCSRIWRSPQMEIPQLLWSTFSVLNHFLVIFFFFFIFIWPDDQLVKYLYMYICITESYPKANWH